jgi:hypothetical protein
MNYLDKMKFVALPKSGKAKYDILSNQQAQTINKNHLKLRL